MYIGTGRTDFLYNNSIMQINECYTEFCEFWTAYRPADKFANRRSCTFSQWLKRSPPARRAMLDQVHRCSVNPDRNPFFWVQDFPEPVPKDYNGSREFDRLILTTPLVTAEYKGKFGIYTLDDATAYNMKIKIHLNP